MKIYMSWKYKALLQLVFSSIPYGEHLNYFSQRHITKSLPLSQSAFDVRISRAKEYIDLYRQFSSQRLNHATFYEFGVGWDLIIPLTFYAFGVNRQILIDIIKLSRSELLNDAIAKFRISANDLGFLRKPDKLLDKHMDGFVALLKECYGIEYKAPCDSRETGLLANSIDCITSTNTLEHINSQDIGPILNECNRILRGDGIMIFRIDYEDHYAKSDSRISVFNFLQYSDKKWSLFSPSLHFQNRLRHKDYIKLFHETDFEIMYEHRQDATEKELETIKLLRLDKRFMDYSDAELGVHNSLFVLRKKIINNT